MKPENTRRNHAGRWRPGVSGNKAGKPKGARHKATIAAEELLEGEAEALSRKAVEIALKGDVAALRLCLDRILPVRKDRPVIFEIPKMTEVKDAVSATAAVAAAVAAGELTPCEAAELSKLIEAYTRSLQAAARPSRSRRLVERRSYTATDQTWATSPCYKALACRCWPSEWCVFRP